jgi:hypothetical protein
VAGVAEFGDSRIQELQEFRSYRSSGVAELGVLESGMDALLEEISGPLQPTRAPSGPTAEPFTNSVTPATPVTPEFLICSNS